MYQKGLKVDYLEDTPMQYNNYISPPITFFYYNCEL